MPMQRNLYPKNWEAIAYKIKEKAQWHCEECGRPCRRPGETLESLILRLSTAKSGNWLPDLYDSMGNQKPTRFILTVAHLNHEPSDCNNDNLKALCAVCHLRYDSKQRSRKKRLKLERNGQLILSPTDWLELGAATVEEEPLEQELETETETEQEPEPEQEEWDSKSWQDLVESSNSFDRCF